MMLILNLNNCSVALSTFNSTDLSLFKSNKIIIAQSQRVHWEDVCVKRFSV